MRPIALENVRFVSGSVTPGSGYFTCADDAYLPEVIRTPWQMASEGAWVEAARVMCHVAPLLPPSPLVDGLYVDHDFPPSAASAGDATADGGNINTPDCWLRVR